MTDKHRFTFGPKPDYDILTIGSSGCTKYDLTSMPLYHGTRAIFVSKSLDSERIYTTSFHCNQGFNDITARVRLDEDRNILVYSIGKWDGGGKALTEFRRRISAIEDGTAYQRDESLAKLMELPWATKHREGYFTIEGHEGPFAASKTGVIEAFDTMTKLPRKFNPMNLEDLINIMIEFEGIPF